MAKPTRKHPGFNSVEHSPQGREFLRLTGTQARDEDVTAPRRRMEPMERITAASDL